MQINQLRQRPHSNCSQYVHSISGVSLLTRSALRLMADAWRWTRCRFDGIEYLIAIISHEDDDINTIPRGLHARYSKVFPRTHIFSILLVTFMLLSLSLSLSHSSALCICPICLWCQLFEIHIICTLHSGFCSIVVAGATTARQPCYTYFVSYTLFIFIHFSRRRKMRIMKHTDGCATEKLIVCNPNVCII